MSLFEFTTGAGPMAVPERLEPPALDLRVIDYVFGSCGETSAICLDAVAPPGTTIEVRIGEEVLPNGSAHPSARYRTYGAALAEEDCLEVRVRDVRGNRSEPSVICGDALVRARFTPDGIEHVSNCEAHQGLFDAATMQGSAEADPDGVSDAESSLAGGCALNRAGREGGGFGALAVAVAALLGARSRRVRVTR